MTTLEARELRIGNLITVISCHKIKDDFVAEATIGDIDRIDSNSLKTWRYEPIPLTEEWLLKLGLYKSIENAGNLECYKKGNITIAKWIGDKWKVWIDSKDLRKSPKHVHQIQNLYHALTGEELEIKDQ